MSEADGVLDFFPVRFLLAALESDDGSEEGVGTLVVDLERVDLAGEAAVFLVAFVAFLSGDFFAAGRDFRTAFLAFFAETFRVARFAKAVFLPAAAFFPVALVLAFFAGADPAARAPFDLAGLADLDAALTFAFGLVAAAFLAVRRPLAGEALAGLEAVADLCDLRVPAFRAIGVGKRRMPPGN